MITILNNKGTTLVETLFAFSIFVSCIIFLISFYVVGHKENINVNKQYEAYIIKQQEKEQNICFQEDFQEFITKVLH